MGFNQNSSFGFGSNGGGGGGGSVSGANDGLSLSGTVAQLGQTVGAVGNPAALLEDREIPLNGAEVWFAADNLTDRPNDIVLISPNSISISADFSNPTHNPALSLSEVSSGISFSQVIRPDSNNIVTATINYGGANSIVLNFTEDGGVPAVQLFTNQNPGIFANSQDLFQVFGSMNIDISSSNTQTGNSLTIVPFTDANGNFNVIDVTGTGYFNLNAQYNGSNGGNFQGTFNLNQNINFNSGAESQQGINSNININWENDALGSISVFSFNEVQLQFNMNAAGDTNPAQINVNSSGAYYGPGWYVYRGMNPLGSDGTGALAIISGGDQSSTTRVVPLASYATRTDFNNGGQVDVTGPMASYHSDLAIGAPGSLETFIDYSAGGGFNVTSGGFTLGTRIAFWAQDLTRSQNTNLGYAFKSEGPEDLSWLAGKLQVGGPDTLGTYDTTVLVYGTLAWSLMVEPNADSVAVPVVAFTDAGKVFTDEGSTSGTTSYLLPAPAAGQQYFFACVSVSISITLASGSINFSGNIYSTSLSSSAIGSFIHLVAIDSSTYYVASSTGSWSGV